jgi:hypothetical protein
MTKAIDNTGNTLIQQDTPCRRCGYNLRGLFEDGQCPECGTPVKISLRHGLLQHSDPDWLDALRRGILLILGYIFAVFVYLLCAGLLESRHVRLPGSGLPVVTGILFCVNVCGYYLLTMREPNGGGETEYGVARQVARWSVAAGLCNLFAGNAFGLLGRELSSLATVRLVTLLNGCLATLIGFTGVFALLLYLENSRCEFPIPSFRSGRALSRFPSLRPAFRSLSMRRFLISCRRSECAPARQEPQGPQARPCSGVAPDCWRCSLLSTGSATSCCFQRYRLD